MTSNRLSSSLRPTEQAAKTRSLRDRRTVNLEDLESQLISNSSTSSNQATTVSPQKLTHSQTMELIHASKSNTETEQGKSFDALVQKYTRGPATSYEAQFYSAKSVFERAESKASLNNSKSAPGTPSPKKSPLRMIDS